MAGVHVCAVCDHTYDETDRKPLVLLCGHTYCQQCLHNVVSGSSPACPSCRKEIVTPVNELPVNFVALPFSSGEAASGSVASTKMFCNTHQNELDYWCSQCKVLICKRCLVQTHAKHEFILAEEIFADGRILPDMKSQVNTNLQRLEAFIFNLQQLESWFGMIDEVKNSIPQLKKAVLKQESTLDNLLKVLEKVTSEPSLEQKNLVLKMLRDQNQMQFKEVNVSKALESLQDQGVQCQISDLANGRKDKPTEKYMPDGLPWLIISPELAEKALCTMKETGHQTPNATVISTDESPILCLPELLQYLAASSAAMELQLMDKALKDPYKKDWLPLKAGGDESTDFKHCYRLTILAKTVKYFQTLAAALTTVGEIVNDAAENKVIVLVDPKTRTYDVFVLDQMVDEIDPNLHLSQTPQGVTTIVSMGISTPSRNVRGPELRGVLAFGEVVKGDTGSWPLPLEVHVVGMVPWQHQQLEWVQCIVPSLYYIAQPDMGECRVYLPEYDVRFHTSPSGLCSVFAEVGQKFSTQHRLYLPGSVPDDRKPAYRREAEQHKLALEFRDF